MNDVMQEAETLLVLEAQATPERLELGLSVAGGREHAADAIMVGEEGGAFCVPVELRTLSVLLVALRNRAPAVIRALMERVEEWKDIADERAVKLNHLTHAIVTFVGAVRPVGSETEQARIESLEAERNLEYERAQRICDAQVGAPPAKTLSRFTPEEIAARVEQKQKGKSDVR